VSKKELQQKCATLEEKVRARRLATDDELAEYRPARRSAPLWDWIWWYAQLVRFCGRLEVHESAGAEADALIVAALRAEPKAVALGERSLQVHPKSFDALLNIHARDQLLIWLTTRYAALRDNANGADAMQFLERTAAEIAYQNQLLAWSVTTPGPGLPFVPEADDRPQPPDEIKTLEPWDILRLHQAFVEVNVARLNALDKLIDPPKGDDKGGRPSWSVFIGSLSMKWQVDPKKLMRDQALVQLLAVVKLAAPAPVDEAAA
jgi:hypothetical protein